MRSLLLTAFTLAACGDGHSYVVVRVSNDDAPLALLSFSVVASNNGMNATVSIGNGSPFTVPPAQSFALQVDGRTGELHVDVVAIGSDGPLAHAADNVQIVPAGTAHLELSLTTDVTGERCSDGIQDGDETGLDCGGTCPRKCDVGAGCGAASDCMSGYCNQSTGVCGPGHCADHLRDADEIDVDCGGSCERCDVDRSCAQDDDCQTGVCIDSFCGWATAPPFWEPAPGSWPSNYQAIGPGAASQGKIVGLYTFYSIVAGDNVFSVLEYDTLTGKLDLTSYPSKVPNNTVVGLAFDRAGSLYAMSGGTSQNTATATTAVWNGQVWFGLADEPGGGHAGMTPVLAPDGYIYAVGGQGPSTNTGDLYAYDPQHNSWIGQNYMPETRYGCGAAAVGTRIYCIGGVGSDAKAGGFVYDLTTQKWTSIAEMSRPRPGSATVLAPDGRIVVIGGNTPTTTTATVEAYSPDGNHWTPLAPMATPRTALIAGVGGDGRLFAFGGVDQSGSTPTYPHDFEAYGPVVVANPSTTTAGGTITLTGGNFAANAKVSVWLGNANGKPLAVGSTDGAGALTAPIVVTAPGVPGAFTLLLRDHRSRYMVNLTVVVK